GQGSKGIILQFANKQCHGNIAYKDIHAVRPCLHLVQQPVRVLVNADICLNDLRSGGSSLDESRADIPFVRGSPLIGDGTVRTSTAKGKSGGETNPHGAARYQGGLSGKVGDHATDWVFD